MAEHSITSIAGILLAIVGLAIISTLVSPRAQTGMVIRAGGTATEQALCTALSPVTGANCGIPSVNSVIQYGIPSVNSTINYGGVVTPV